MEWVMIMAHVKGNVVRNKDDNKRRKEAEYFREVIKNAQVLGGGDIKKAVISSTALGLGKKCVGKKAKDRHKELVARAISSQE